ncbi:hypothetical protein ACPF34_002539 [Vibrio cholerae]
MLRQFIEDGNLNLDMEFGNQHSFFSGSREGYCSTRDYGKNALRRELYAEIPESRGQITELVDVENNQLSRQLGFVSEGDAFLFDFVSRYVVISNNRSAFISGVEIKHKNSNIYYQYSADRPVKVPVDEKHWLEFHDKGSSSEKYFDNVFYIRDESQQDGRFKWIVHHRKIVKPKYAKLILRGCNPRIEGVIPCQKWIPKTIKNMLFRIREKKYPNFPLMAVGVVNVQGAPLSLATEIKLSEDV